MLVDEVLDFLKCRLPVKRVLINALDDTSLKRAMEEKNIHDNEQYKNLKLSAQARQRVDWLIGINATRFYTLSARNQGYDGVLKVGRVKTPVLALVHERVREIANFQPQKYFKIQVSFEGAKFIATWISADKSERLLDLGVAREVEAKLKGQSATVAKIEGKTIEKKQPEGYSLSRLQIEAGARFGTSPDCVLEIAQKLYEKKLTTYPRSSSCYLPVSQLQDAEVILKHLTGAGDDKLARWAKGANPKIKSQIWDDTKIDAHHAIIPTMQAAKMDALSSEEKSLYFMIVQNYISQFYPEYQYGTMKARIECAGEIFETTGKIIKNLGWKTLYKEKEEEQAFRLNEGDTLNISEVKVVEKKTEPPPYYTQATIIEAMESIHRFAPKEDKTILKKTGGIGTEATRATVIKDLLDSGLLEEKTDKKKPYVVVTAQGEALLEVLDDKVKSAEFTASMESQLMDIEMGEKQIDALMEQTRAYLRSLKQTAFRPLSGTTLCPVCGQGVLQRKKGKQGYFWGCSRWPDCNSIFSDYNNAPFLEKCEKCGAYMRIRKGKKGDFRGCSGYPKCNAILPL